MFDWLQDAVSGNPVSYAVAFGASAGDVLIPIIPSETIVITAGVLAAGDKLSIWLLIPAAAAGAVVGDNLCYWLGRTVGDRVKSRLFRGASGAARLRWAQRAVRRHGAVLVLVGRFIPGGRTVSTFAAGSLEMPWRRFLAADVVAGCFWALYAALLGYAGGHTFEDSTWKPFAVSLGIAGLVMLALEVYRRLQKRAGRDFLGDPLDDAS
jgi:membrane protein DedA with SNARE-associated domain